MIPTRWMPTELDPRKMIAVSTLDAMGALLRAPIFAAAPQGANGNGLVSLRVSEHPSLQAVGGILRVEHGDGPLGIARIGRTSFVAYRLDARGLRQVPLELDEGAGTLHVQPGPPV